MTDMDRAGAVERAARALLDGWRAGWREDGRSTVVTEHVRALRSALSREPREEGVVMCPMCQRGQPCAANPPAATATEAKCGDVPAPIGTIHAVACDRCDGVGEVEGQPDQDGIGQVHECPKCHGVGALNSLLTPSTTATAPSAWGLRAARAMWAAVGKVTTSQRMDEVAALALDAARAEGTHRAGASEGECAGPFVSAFDCPVHDPRMFGIPKALLDAVPSTADQERIARPTPPPAEVEAKRREFYDAALAYCRSALDESVSSDDDRPLEQAMYSAYMALRPAAGGGE